jgi:MoaA/NifB/PqqE/SkfB family radical SAM enzyme
MNVHVYVTPNCNLRCKHCYYDALPLDSVPSDMLEIRELAFIITSLCDNYDTAFDVEGGEFFTRKGIADLFGLVPTECWRHVTITTNGSVEIGLDYDYLRSLDEFRVSVEGHTTALQEEIRGISLEPVLATCAVLRSNRVPITLRITIHKKNYGFLQDMLWYFTGLGFQRFSLYEFQATGRGVGHQSQYGLDEGEVEHVITALCSAALPRDLTTFKLSLSRRRVATVLSHKEELQRSGYSVLDVSGVPSLTVDYNGSLGVCPWNIRSTRIGTFQESSFDVDIRRYLKAGILDHTCDFCSAIRILYQS